MHVYYADIFVLDFEVKGCNLSQKKCKNNEYFETDFQNDSLVCYWSDKQIALPQTHTIG